MSTDPLAERCLWAGCEGDRVPGTVRCTFHTPSDFDLDDDYADVSSVLFDRAPKSSTRLHAFTPEQLAAHDAQVAANGKAALRNLSEAFDRIKAEEWRIFVAATGYDPEDPSEDDYGTCVREAVAQVRADERQKAAALLADEGTVKTVADAICISASGWPDHHGAWTDEARAVLDVLAGLIGGEQ